MSESADKVRSAGVRQEQRLAAGLDTAGVVEAVKQARETDSTYRVYRREWMHQGFFDEPEQALELATERWGGRVRPEDIRVLEPGCFTLRHGLEVRLWNVKAEVKKANVAQNYRQDLITKGTSAEDVEVVARNSRREHELNQFGILKLA